MHAVAVGRLAGLNPGRFLPSAMIYHVLMVGTEFTRTTTQTSNPCVTAVVWANRKLHLRETHTKTVKLHPAPRPLDVAVLYTAKEVNKSITRVQHVPARQNPRLSERVVLVLGERAVCFTIHPAGLR